MIHIVDDEEVLRDVLSLISEDLGFRTMTFGLPAEYIQYMESEQYEKPKVMISDITMPGELTGFDLIKKVKEKHPGQLCVAMSGDGSAPSKYKNLACMYLQKPFTSEKLKSVMTAIVACLSHGPEHVLSSCCEVDDRSLFCLQNWSCPH